MHIKYHLLKLLQKDLVNKKKTKKNPCLKIDVLETQTLLLVTRLC